MQKARVWFAVVVLVGFATGCKVEERHVSVAAGGEDLVTVVLDQGCVHVAVPLKKAIKPASFQLAGSSTIRVFRSTPVLNDHWATYQYNATVARGTYVMRFVSTGPFAATADVQIMSGPDVCP